MLNTLQLTDDDLKAAELSLSAYDPDVEDDELKLVVGNAKFSSVTYRCFKLDNLETLCEDYGQVAVYKGSIDTMPHHYVLDDHHVFETGKPVLVCGNTASMVGESKMLGPHFSVMGDRSKHYGEFPCGPAPSMPAFQANPTISSCDSGACGPATTKSKCC